jgi:glycosyltransferase involved in cell wall biosynthesis
MPNEGVAAGVARARRGQCPDAPEDAASGQRPVLSIGIPTWNRRAYLERMIHSVVDQIDPALAWAVEVVVSDNASTDGTETAVAAIARSSGVSIRHLRNETNIGGVRNVLRTLAGSSGEYWTFYGDDDEVAPGALGQIIEVLRASPRAVVVGFLPEHAKAEWLDAAEAAERYFYHLGNAGTFAVDTTCAKAMLADRGDAFFSTCWPQTILEFGCMAASDSPRPCHIVPLVSSRSPDHMENTVYTSFYLLKTTILDLLASARQLRSLVPVEVYEAAKSHVVRSNRFAAMRKAIAIYSTFSDYRDDVRMARVEAWRGTWCNDIDARPYVLSVWLILALPTWVRALGFWVYFHARRSPAKARAAYKTLREEGRATRGRRAADSETVRAYGPSDF